MTPFDIFVAALTILLSLIFAFPLYWAVASALKEPRELYHVPPIWWPKVPQWRNVLEIDEKIPFYLFMRNSAWLTILRTIGGVTSASLVAYGFTFFRFRGRNVLFMLLIGTMMLPDEVTLVPKYVMFSKIGWVDSLKPLTVPVFLGGGAFAVFLFRQFFTSIPAELGDAAKVDGCGPMRFYTKVLLPLATPAIITLSILYFQWSWNDLMGPLIYLHTIEKQTISIGLLTLRAMATRMVSVRGEHTEHMLMMGSVVAMIPSMILFFSLQRYFIRGVIMTGIKG